nr:EOG090X0FIE [Leptodora kindtii]
MVLLKTRFALCRKNAGVQSENLAALQSIRQMSGHPTMKIAPSRWSWNRFKDLLNFYTLLGVIPSTLVILGLNLFVGPAKLAEIPEGYVPEHWEYHSHPLTRFMAKHVIRSYQQEYEMGLQHIYEEDYKRRLRIAENRIREVMAENQDSQSFYYQPYTARYHRFAAEEHEKTKMRSGQN